MEHPSTGNGVSAVIRRNPADGTVTVTGSFTALGMGPQTIAWSAAAPVTRGISFAGSGQPYPNKEIAYENTPNKGVIETVDGSFQITLKDIPAGYYTGLGSVYIPPLIEFHGTSKTEPVRKAVATLWINDTAAPYRWLGGSPATQRPTPNTEDSTGRAMYYAGRDELPLFDNQEALLRAKAYPGDMAARGWPEADDAKPWTHIPAPA
jgi:hypothetical protein